MTASYGRFLLQFGHDNDPFHEFGCVGGIGRPSLLWTSQNPDRLVDEFDMIQNSTSSHNDSRTPVEIRGMLRQSGLRPTRQRLALAELLYAKGNRHISAEGLHEEAMARNVPVSLATVYNTLHQFTDVGLLREVAVDGSKTYFDTNTSDHHHFFVEDDDLVIDVPHDQIGVGRIPQPPIGYEISRVDVVVRLRRIRG